MSNVRRDAPSYTCYGPEDESRSFRYGRRGSSWNGAVAFVLISRTSIAAIGKPAVIGLTFVSVAFLLWYSIKRAKTSRAIWLLPALLALGYVFAFHVVGILGFRGLSRDMEFSADYLLSVLRVGDIVFVLYASGAALLCLVYRALKLRSR